MKTEKIKGLVAAPFTPMNSNGSINVDVIPELFELYKHNNITGVFINGSTGEGLELTVDERKALAEAWDKVVSKDFKLLVHVGHSSLEEAKTLARHAANCSSVAGISTVGPFYRKPDSVERLVDFCREVAAAAPQTPFYYYHIPSLTGVDLPMYEFLERAAEEIPTLAGIKYSHNDFVDYSRCLQYQDGRFDLIFGSDELLSCGLMLGAEGFIGSTYNLFPLLYHQIFKAFSAGDITEVRKLQNRSMNYVRIIDRYGYAAAAKRLMKRLGVNCGPARLPLHTPTEQQMEELEQVLRRQDFFSYALQKVNA
ncbi:dihydrodipicolinate synthase family protein [Halalkalibaculum sp. DA3122]|uniref:dihydrodipicolinate synthase family protein n=1 Tax=Halalkalibaculum sp. DA3122 TaxID=3373607 RepID=UPI00375482B0